MLLLLVVVVVVTSSSSSNNNNNNNSSTGIVFSVAYQYHSQGPGVQGSFESLGRHFSKSVISRVRSSLTGVSPIIT